MWDDGYDWTQRRYEEVRDLDSLVCRYTPPVARDPESGVYFDRDAALAVVEFFPRFLRHTRGEYAKKPFWLFGWQAEEIIMPLFGWKRNDGYRLFRSAHIEVPKKNGKTPIAMGIMAYMWCADGEEGAYAVAAASAQKQASLVFDLLKWQCEHGPLKKHVVVYTDKLYFKPTDSWAEVISGKANVQDGMELNYAGIDELHRHESRDTFEVLDYATSARRQPMQVVTTTAGTWDPTSIYHEQHEFAVRIQKELITEETFFPYVLAAEEDDDWESEEVWLKCNPGLGSKIKKWDQMRKWHREAKDSPAKKINFLRLQLDRVVNAVHSWLDMDAWIACAETLHMIRLEGKLCYGGLDLSTRVDLTSYGNVFPPFGRDLEKGEFESEAINELWWKLWKWLSYNWIPERKLIERSSESSLPWLAWVQRGLITRTQGNAVDYTQVASDIIALKAHYKIKEIGFDQRNAGTVEQMLQAAGFTLVDMPQNVVTYNAPMKEVEALVKRGLICHGNNEVLNWAMGNVVAWSDTSGNIRPDKRRSKDKIDPAVSIFMAMGRALLNYGKRRSTFFTSGMTVLK